MNAFSLRSMVVAYAAFACATVSAEEHGHHVRRLPAAQLGNFQAAMLQAVNAERAKQGLSPFCTNSKLQTAAQLHSEDQAKNNMMSHTGSNGSQMSARITAQGFKWNGVAENVAAGQDDVASVMQSWMNSDGHRKNIMGDFKFFGTGYAYDASSNYGHYWTQDFGSGSGEVCDGGSSTPVATPAPATTKPATSAPVVTDAPVTDPPVYTSAPATTAPVVTPAPATKTPVYTSSPAAQTPVTKTPRWKKRGKKSKKNSNKIPKTDCKPIY